MDQSTSNIEKQSISSELVNSQKKLPKPIIIILGLIISLAIVAGAIYLWQKYPQDKFCTMEAKICPDGSSVGRIPPDCEFAPCPSVSIELDKISPDLQERLEKSQTDERIKVAIYVKEKEGINRPSRPSFEEKEMTQKQIDDFLAQVDKENMEIVEETVKPVVIKLENMGISG